jgi:hypothetical protein
MLREEYEKFRAVADEMDSSRSTFASSRSMAAADALLRLCK